MRTFTICEKCVQELHNTSELLGVLYEEIATVYCEEKYLLGYYDYPSKIRTAVRHLEHKGYVVTTEAPLNKNTVYIHPVVQKQDENALICRGH